MKYCNAVEYFIIYCVKILDLAYLLTIIARAYTCVLACVYVRIDYHLNCQATLPSVNDASVSVNI